MATTTVPSSLKGKPPVVDGEKEERLKLLLFGEAGSGKTWNSILPTTYILDCEKGTDHYPQLILDSGSVVSHINTLDEAIAEVHALIKEQHGYTTLLIDPLTTIYAHEVDKMEDQYGDEFGRHYGKANRKYYRLCRLLTSPSLDMNVIATAHNKNAYNAEHELSGQTFDAGKKTDFIFDLVFQLMLSADRTERFAYVRKSRLPNEFPQNDRFRWSYDELARRYGKERLERTACPVQLASEEQVVLLRSMVTSLDEADKKALKYSRSSLAKVDDFSDLPTEVAAVAIEKIGERLKGK